MRFASKSPHGWSILDTFHVPAGSFNPVFSRGTLWVTQADGAKLTGIDAASGKTVASIATGPNPRFLAAGGGAAATSPLPMARCGPRCRSLGVGHGAIWLTDYHAGTLSRIAIKDVLAHCPGG